MVEQPGERHEFDWVQVRSDCTAEKVFERLKAEVKHDLEELYRCNPGRMRSLGYVTPEPKIFGIAAQPDGVFFDLMSKTIEVKRVAARLGDQELMMRLSVEFNDKGECMLVDGDGKSWLRWQVRRHALEGMFFGT